MKQLLIIVSLFISSCGSNKKLSSEQIKKDKEAISKVLHQQAKDWSNASIEAFMEGYQKTENLLFVGKSGITKGWKQTLDRYKKGYPSKDHTGNLTFNIIEIQAINSEAYLLVGEFHLTRNIGNADGIFTLVFKNINDQWKVISDHTSAYDND